MEAKLGGSDFRTPLDLLGSKLILSYRRERGRSVGLALFSLCIFSEELEMHIWAIKYAGPLRQDDTVQV